MKFHEKQTFLRQQRLQKQPSFPSDHSLRSELKTTLLIQIFSSNSSVFIYLAHNGNVYFYILNHVFSNINKTGYFYIIFGIFPSKKGKKKTKSFLYNLIKDNFKVQISDKLQQKKVPKASERCQHMLKRRLMSHFCYCSNANRRFNLISFNRQLKCGNQWNVMSQTLQELLD